MWHQFELLSDYSMKRERNVYVRQMNVFRVTAATILFLIAKIVVNISFCKIMQRNDYKCQRNIRFKSGKSIVIALNAFLINVMCKYSSVVTFISQRKHSVFNVHALIQLMNIRACAYLTFFSYSLNSCIQSWFSYISTTVQLYGFIRVGLPYRCYIDNSRNNYEYKQI